MTETAFIINLESLMKGDHKTSTRQRGREDAISVVRHLISDEIEALDTSKDLLEGRNREQNQLLGTLDLSFCEHVPLVLSPDDLLLPLVHSAAWVKNIRAQNQPQPADKKKPELVVRRDDFVIGNPKNPWYEIFAEFRTQIASYVGQDNTDLYTGSFTTTGQLQQSAYDVALMDAYQSEFSYHNAFMCGIPSITLLGTKADWEQFRTRSIKIVEGMAVDDKEWNDAICETIRKICDSVAGTLPDPENFWGSIYRWSMHSGGAGVDGWINYFFPIIREGKKHIIGDFGFICGKKFWTRTRSVSSYASSLASAPVTCNDRGKKHSLRYYAGQIGTSQNSDGSIQPAWGWIIAHETPI